MELYGAEEHTIEVSAGQNGIFTRLTTLGRVRDIKNLTARVQQYEEDQ